MDDVHSTQLTDLSYDVDLYGLDQDLWKSAGTVDVSSGDLRVRNDGSVDGVLQSTFQVRRGVTKAKISIPTIPTAADDRRWGYFSVSKGLVNCFFFDIVDDDLIAKSYDKDGTLESTTITWEAGWTATETVWEFRPSARGVDFYVDGRRLANHQTSFPIREALSFYMKNGNSDDNMLLAYLDVKGADQILHATGNPQAGMLVTSIPGSTAASTTDSDDSVAYEASAIHKAAPGVLYGLTVYNSLATDQWIQLHDSATVPADTAVPAVTVVVRGLSNLSIDFPDGRYFTAGIVSCNSSTGPTKTIGSADCWFNAQYK